MGSARARPATNPTKVRNSRGPSTHYPSDRRSNRLRQRRWAKTGDLRFGFFSESDSGSFRSLVGALRSNKPPLFLHLGNPTYVTERIGYIPDPL